MDISRGVFDVETTVRKLSSRLRRPSRLIRSEWPVISASRPLFCFIRFFGLAPFEISQDHFIPGNYSLIYSLFCFIIHTYVTYIVLRKFSSVDRGDQGILDVTETAKVVLNYFVTVFNILVAVWTRKDFIDVLNIVKDYDSRIRDLGYPRKEVAAKIWVWSTCICSTFVWIIVNRTGMVAFIESWMDNLAYILNYVATSLSIIKFSSIVLLLGKCFQHLNKIGQRNQECATTKQKYIAIDIKIIQQLHNSLMNAGENLASQYSWPLMFWLMNLCVHSVSNLYFLIDWLMITPVWDSSRWSLVICIAWWLVTFVVQLLLLHFACHFASSEANSMGSILLDWNSSRASRDYALDTSLQFVNRKLNFSAAGCFFVNFPLLSSITGLLTTYLVILLQTRD